MKVPTDARAPYLSERPRVVGLLALDAAETRLPAAVRAADGVPELAVRVDTNDVQFALDAGASDEGEGRGIVGLMAFDEAEGGLPGPGGVTDGVPELSTDHADDVKIAPDTRAADRREAAGIVVLLAFN